MQGCEAFHISFWWILGGSCCAVYWLDDVFGRKAFAWPCLDAVEFSSFVLAAASLLPAVPVLPMGLWQHHRLKAVLLIPGALQDFRRCRCIARDNFFFVHGTSSFSKQEVRACRVSGSGPRKRRSFWLNMDPCCHFC